MRFFIIFFLFVFHTFGQVPKNYDIQNLTGHIQIDPWQQKVSGKIIYQIKITRTTDNIHFDAPGIQTLKVKTGCFKTKFVQKDKYLIINKNFKKNKTYTIKITYTAYPKKAMYFTGWQTNGRKQVWTQGQGKDNAHWLPVNSDQNDKFTWQLSITAPKGYRIISNGKQIENQMDKDSLTTATYQMTQPAPAYLIFVGIGKYDEQKKLTKSGIPLFNYQYPDKITHDKTYYRSRFIFDWLNSQIPVAYPWKNYKQIPCKDFLYGGMENVSATSFNGDRYVVDSIDFADHNFVNVSAHELAHQWFGDLVTGKSSADHWLHEGFATYYARLVDEQIFGKNYNDYKVYQYDQQIITSQNTDTVPLHRPNASSLTYYQKGARIVQMFRQELGNQKYQKLIRNYLTRYQFKNASIADFQKIIYEVTGDSLPKFFHLWFETQDIPKFVLQQKQDSIIFIQNSHQLPLEFMVLSKNKTYTIEKSKSFKLSDFKNITTIIANPDNQKLYEIDFRRNKKWLKNQILYAHSFIDVYKALPNIRNWSFAEKDSLFDQLIAKQHFYPVYGEILKQIKHDLTETHLNFIQKMLQKDSKTRQQIALELDSIPRAIKDKYKTLLDDASYVTKQVALWHYWVQFPQERTVILEATKNLTGGNDKAFRLTWLSLALMTKNYEKNNKMAFAREMIDYSSPDYNMLIRLNAFEMLLQMQLITPEVIDNLIDAAFHFNWRMHQPARKFLKQIAQKREFKTYILEKMQSLPENKQRVIKNLFAGE